MIHIYKSSELTIDIFLSFIIPKLFESIITKKNYLNYLFKYVLTNIKNYGIKYGFRPKRSVYTKFIHLSY